MQHTPTARAISSSWDTAGRCAGLSRPLMDMPAEYMWRLRLSNCSVSVINTFRDDDSGSAGAALELLNDTSHLEDVIKNVFAAGR